MNVIQHSKQIVRGQRARIYFFSQKKCGIKMCGIKRTIALLYPFFLHLTTEYDQKQIVFECAPKKRSIHMENRRAICGRYFPLIHQLVPSNCLVVNHPMWKDSKIVVSNKFGLKSIYLRYLMLKLYRHTLCNFACTLKCLPRSNIPSLICIIEAMHFFFCWFQFTSFLFRFFSLFFLSTPTEMAAF